MVAYRLGAGMVLVAALLASPAFAAVPPEANPPVPTLPGSPNVAGDRNPVEAFRRLLDMNPEALEKALLEKSENQRRFLRLKVQEYRAMNPAERESRLRVSELRWRLEPLLRSAPDQRASAWEVVPAADRPLLESRLREWDAMPADLQTQLLGNEPALQQILRLDSLASPPMPGGVNPTVSKLRPASAPVAALDSLPPDQQAHAYDQFRRFLELDPETRTKVLKAVPEESRLQLGIWLRMYEGLTDAERREFLQAARRFAEMSSNEREAFVRQVRVWQRMSAEERRAWRELTSRLPPMPPGLDLPRSGIPPVNTAQSNRPSGPD